MNNLYRKIAVASVCTALGFALGASEEAKAATFSFSSSNASPSITFHAIDGELRVRGESFGTYGSFDGLGDAVINVDSTLDWESGNPHSWSHVERTTVGEIAALVEFYESGYYGNSRITSITNAVLRIPVMNSLDGDSSHVLGVFGYVGNGTAEASDLEAGVFLNSTEITEFGGPQYADFNVTPFLNEIISNNNDFAGFAVRSLTQNGVILPTGLNGRPVWLITEGEYEIVEPEPVPEPTTIFGSAIGLGLGGWLKRKKSSQQNKTTSQG